MSATAVLMDHVSAYAAAVRAHLADLPPEQVEDLTDGLEADLAEALADAATPAADAASGATAPDAVAAASAIDLTRHFGPAAAYAAELRAAAGLAPALPPGRRPSRPGRVRRYLHARADRVRSWWAVSVGPALESPAGRSLVAFLVALRPAWWVLRGWAWFVVIASLLGAPMPDRFVPTSAVAWAWLAALVVLSVQVGRGLGTADRWGRRAVAVGSAVAVVTVPLALGTLTDWGARSGPGSVQYVETVVYEPVPADVEDGVYVDGMQVSNLFVYDADGNPLEGVQIFDDRGRPVRTTYDDGGAEWWMPGVEEPWRFLPRETVDGRLRWNVYPLLGIPAWSGDPEADGLTPQLPPPPFAKAPPLVGAAADDAAPAEGADPAADGAAVASEPDTAAPPDAGD